MNGPTWALWTSCVDWGLSVDLMQRVVLAGVKPSSGLDVPIILLLCIWLSCVGWAVTQILHGKSDQFSLFTYPRRAHYTNTTIMLTQENLCLFPVHMCYKSLLQLASLPPSAPAVEKGGEKLLFHKGHDKHHWLRLRDLEGEHLKYGAHFVRHFENILYGD